MSSFKIDRKNLKIALFIQIMHTVYSYLPLFVEQKYTLVYFYKVLIK